MKMLQRMVERRTNVSPQELERRLRDIDYTPGDEDDAFSIAEGLESVISRTGEVHDPFAPDAPDEADGHIQREEPPPRKAKYKETFMNMGEYEPFEDADTAEDEEDDISSLAHGELEHHRELRHYARLAAWEMPLLYSELHLRKTIKGYF